MKKEVAKKLLKLVNVKSNTDLLEFYAKERVQILYRQMERLPVLTRFVRYKVPSER